MGIKRTIIIPVILALGTAASSVTARGRGARGVQRPVVAVASHMSPSLLYQG